MNRKHLIHGASPKAARTPHHQPQERQWSGIPIAKPKLARRDHRTQTLNEAKKKKKTVCCRSLIKTFAQFSCLPSVSLARQDAKRKKSNQPHTHDRSRQKKKATTPLFQNRAARTRGRQLVLITSPRSSLLPVVPFSPHRNTIQKTDPPQLPTHHAIPKNRQTQHISAPKREKSSKP